VISRPNADLSHSANEDVLDALLGSHTCDVGDSPNHRMIVDSKLVIKFKAHSDGTVDKSKARLMAK
jgi:hypothetical protein